MVGHQTICVNFAAELTFQKHEILQIVIEVVVSDKYWLPVMASLNDVVRGIGQNYSR